MSSPLAQHFAGISFALALVFAFYWWRFGDDLYLPAAIASASFCAWLLVFF